VFTNGASTAAIMTGQECDTTTTGTWETDYDSILVKYYSDTYVALLLFT